MAVDLSAVERAISAKAVDIAERLAEEWVDTARAFFAPHDRSGDGSASIQVVDVREGPRNVSARVAAGVGLDPNYMAFQEEGTGIYGPQGTPIVPVNARVLRWEDDEAGVTVYAMSSSGSRPVRYWADTIADWPNICARVQR